MPARGLAPFIFLSMKRIIFRMIFLEFEWKILKIFPKFVGKTYLIKLMYQRWLKGVPRSIHGLSDCKTVRLYTLHGKPHRTFKVKGGEYVVNYSLFVAKVTFIYCLFR